MKAQQTFSILFWLAKNRIKNGKAPISVRLTVNGQRTEFSAQREVSPNEWDQKSQIVIGRTQEAKEINNQLAKIKAKLLNCESKLEARGAGITAETLKLEYTGVLERPRMLVEIITQHNTDIKTLIGKEYSKATWVKYEARPLPAFKPAR